MKPYLARAERTRQSGPHGQAVCPTPPLYGAASAGGERQAPPPGVNSGAHPHIRKFTCKQKGQRVWHVPTPEEVDISGKADKATGATTGNFAALDGEGNLTDSGKKPADFVAAETGKRLMTDAEGEKLAGVSEGATKTAASSTNGNVNIDGKEVVVYTEPENVLHDEDVEDFSAEEIAALLADTD